EDRGARSGEEQEREREALREDTEHARVRQVSEREQESVGGAGHRRGMTGAAACVKRPRLPWRAAAPKARAAFFPPAQDFPWPPPPVSTSSPSAMRSSTFLPAP